MTQAANLAGMFRNGKCVASSVLRSANFTRND